MADETYKLWMARQDKGPKAVASNLAEFFEELKSWSDFDTGNVRYKADGDRTSVSDILDYYVLHNGEVYSSEDLCQCPLCKAWAPLQVTMADRGDQCVECDEDNRS